jgi:hypothetical protein
MNLSSIIQKPKKISIKYFLRKEQFSKMLVSGYEIDTKYYPLYIEFIHRRKVNRCKSLYLDFLLKDTQNAAGEDINHIQFNIYGVTPIAFTNEIEQKINSNDDLQPSRNLTFLDLLIFEKHHANATFKLFANIPDDKFTLSHLGEGYKYSLKFVFNYYENYLKNLVINELLAYLPYFPNIIDKSKNLNDLCKGIIQLIPLIDNDLFQDGKTGEAFLNFAVSISKIGIKAERYIIYDNKLSSIFGITIPVWTVENHLEKFQEFMLDISSEYYGMKEKDSYIYKPIVLKMIETVEMAIGNDIEKIKNFFGYRAE